MKSLVVLLLLLLVKGDPLMSELKDIPTYYIMRVREQIYCEKQLPECHQKCPGMVRGEWNATAWFPAPGDSTKHDLDIINAHMVFCMSQLARCRVFCGFEYTIIWDKEVAVLAREMKREDDQKLEDAMEAVRNQFRDQL